MRVLGTTGIFVALVLGCESGNDEAPGGRPWLVDVTDEYGIDFVHESGARGSYHLPEINGSGLALVDLDGDADLDLYLVNGNDSSARPRPMPSPTNRYYALEDGRYVDRTEESGLGDGGYGVGVATGDIEGDGDLDVYVANIGPDRLFRNRGAAVFDDVTEAAGIDVPTWSSSAAFADLDLDGDLDLFLCQYLVYDPEKHCHGYTGRPDYCVPSGFTPLSDILLENRGDGTFVDVSERAGLRTVRCAALGVVCQDLDGDGELDVYVTNDGYPNHLWRNVGDGTFVEEASIKGSALNALGHPEASMGVVAEDLDDDGRLDLFMTHLAKETNTFYRGRADGFRDETVATGLGPSSMPYTGFGVAAFDVELDGDLDLAIANGRVLFTTPRPDAVPAPPLDGYAEPNLFYLGDGGRFHVAGPELAAFCDPVEISRGLVTGDVDADGDLDVALVNVQGRARLYRNDAPRRGRWLAVRAVTTGAANVPLAALGAVVTVVAGDRRFLRTVSSAWSYASSAEPEAHFGLGDVQRYDSIEVRWPGGSVETFPGGDVDRRIVLVRGEGAAR